MSFQKFVRRSTKGLMLFIAVMMILPLVLWGYMGSDGGADEKGNEPAGRLSGWGVTVTKHELEQYRRRALADWWWKQYTGPQAYMMRFRRPDPPKPEELERLAWQTAVLLADARLKGVGAAPKEIDSRLRDFYLRMTGSQDVKGADEILASQVRQYFQTDLQTFEGWFSDNVVIDKLLDTVSEASFEDYEKVHEQLGHEQVQMKVAYAALDARAFEKRLRPAGAEEIARRFEQNKDSYKVPARASVTYLMAELEGFQKGIAEPTEAEIEAWYQAHRAEYAKPHEHKPGEEHRDDEKTEYRSLQEVRGEIPAKIRNQKASEQARALMSDVQKALGELYSAAEKKYPGDAFVKLKEKFQGKAELKFDVAPFFTARDVEGVEGLVGTGSQLGTWAFDPAVKPGEISKLVSTSKGVVLFRLLERKDPFTPGLTDRVRAKLEGEIRKEHLRKLTQKAASDVVQEITASGVASARAKWPLEWSETRYFKGRDGDTGIEDRSLSVALAGHASSLGMKAGQASVMSGASVTGKADWSFVVVLDDVLPAPSDDASLFAQTRRRLDEERRREFREKYPGLMVEAAKVEKSGS